MLEYVAYIVLPLCNQDIVQLSTGRYVTRPAQVECVMQINPEATNKGFTQGEPLSFFHNDVAVSYFRENKPVADEIPPAPAKTRLVLNVKDAFND